MPKVETRSRDAAGPVSAPADCGGLVEGADGWLIDPKAQIPAFDPADATVASAVASWRGLLARYRAAGLDAALVIMPDRNRILSDFLPPDLKRDPSAPTLADAVRLGLEAVGATVIYPFAELARAVADGAQVYHKSSPLWTSWACWLSIRAAVARLAPDRSADLEALGGRPVDVDLTSSTGAYAARAGRSVRERPRLVRLERRRARVTGRRTEGDVRLVRYDAPGQEGVCLVAGDAAVAEAGALIAELYSRTYCLEGAREAPALLDADAMSATILVVSETALLSPDKAFAGRPPQFDAIDDLTHREPPDAIPAPPEPSYIHFGLDAGVDETVLRVEGEGWREAQLHWTAGEGATLVLQSPDPKVRAWAVLISYMAPRYWAAEHELVLADLTGGAVVRTAAVSGALIDLHPVYPDPDGRLRLALSHPAIASQRELTGEGDRRALGVALRWARLTPLFAENL